MNAFLPFILAASVLALLTVFWLSRPWWQEALAQRLGRRPASADLATPLPGATLNAAIYRDQLAELARDHAHGLIGDDDFAVAREELSRRLLDDVSNADTTVAKESQVSQSSSPQRRRRAPTWFAMLLLIPLAAASLYLQFGTPAAALDTVAQARRSMGEMEQAVSSLAQKLEANPDNPEGWAMLARSYGMLGRWDESIKAFERIGPSLDTNPDLLATFAEVRFRGSKNQFTPEVRTLVAQALALAPEHMHALLLAGSDAFQSGKWQIAIDHWEKLVPQLDPASDDARELTEGINRARAELGPNAPTVRSAESAKSAASAGSANSSGTAAATRAEAISGRIELDPAMRKLAKPESTVFVLARAASTDDVPAPRMPLAALRIRVTDLPFNFSLDDSMAMNPSMKISNFAQVRIEARVSASGNAMATSGDLIGQSDPVKPGSKKLVVRISREIH